MTFLNDGAFDFPLGFPLTLRYIPASMVLSFLRDGGAARRVDEDGSGLDPTSPASRVRCRQRFVRYPNPSA